MGRIAFDREYPKNILFASGYDEKQITTRYYEPDGRQTIALFHEKELVFYRATADGQYERVWTIFADSSQDGSVQPLLKTVRFHLSAQTVAAGQVVSFDINADNQSYYKPICACGASTNHGSCALVTFWLHGTSVDAGRNAGITVRNCSSANVSCAPYIDVLYMKVAAA